jgi:hypothetical protein
MARILFTSLVFVPALGLATTFDSSYVMQSNLPNTMLQNMQQNVATRAEIAAQLEQNGEFSGLYFRVEGKSSLNSDYYDARIGVDFEVFNNGYYEAKREGDKKRLQNQLELLQQQVDMENRLYEQVFFQTKLIANTIKLKSMQKQSALLFGLKSYQQQQLKMGRITKAEYAKAELALEKVSTMLQHYQNIQAEKVPHDWQIWLNNIEKLSLKTTSAIMAFGLANSASHQIQNVLQQRSEFQPSYLDKVQLKVFVEHREQSGPADWDLSTASLDGENIVGVAARLPIDFSGSREQLVTAQKQSYRQQQQAIALRLEQKVASLSDQFSYKQALLKQALASYSLLNIEREQAIKQMRSEIGGLDYQPEQKINQLALERVRVEETILLTRLETFSLLEQLRLLLNESDFSRLIN